MEFVLLIAAACALLLWIMYLIAKEFYKVAQAKGFYEKKYLWLPFLLGVIGYLLVISLPDRASDTNTASDELPDL